MDLIDKVLVKPTINTSLEALKGQREKENKIYLFTKIDTPEVITYYLQDLKAQGYDVSSFGLD